MRPRWGYLVAAIIALIALDLWLLLDTRWTS